MANKYTIDLTDGITSVRFTKQLEEDLYSAIDNVAENYFSELRLWDFSSEGIDLSSNQYVP